MSDSILDNCRCPYCEPEQGCVDMDDLPVFKDGGYFVKCVTCGASGPVRDTREEAVADWQPPPEDDARDTVYELMKRMQPPYALVAYQGRPAVVLGYQAPNHVEVTFIQGGDVVRRIVSRDEIEPLNCDKLWAAAKEIGRP